MGLLRFTLEYMDFLAWPILALGYPLCASIRAIETGSKYHMRKLVIYWTIFSLISLFEYVFEKLINWVPLWPYLKLSVICWLVIPQFNGACYFYQNLIHPCLVVKLRDVVTHFYGASYVLERLLNFCMSVNLQIVTDWFKEPKKDPNIKKEMFLAVAERYLEENGSEALEKLLASKSKECGLDHRVEGIKTSVNCVEVERHVPNQLPQTESKGGTGPVWEDIKVIEHKTKREAADANQARSIKENVVQIEKKTAKPVQVNETAFPAGAEEIKPPEAFSSKTVQTEWTCAICQVTTTSELTLKSHLQGRKHLAKAEQLKTSKQTAKNAKNPPCTTNTSNKLKQAQEKYAPMEVSKLNNHEKSKEKVQLGATLQQEKQRKLKNSGVATQNFKLWCGFCNVRCLSEIDMAAHLIGKKHLSNLQEIVSSAGETWA